MLFFCTTVFDKILTSEYDLWKSQVNEKDAKKVSFDQYRKAVSYVGDYDYKSIRDKQIGRELVFKIGVYTVAAIVAVPCVLTGNAPGALLSFSVAGYVCGSTSVTGAITGTNPISGRTISSEERWVEGISGGVQVLSGAYGIYSYAPPAFANALNTPTTPIRSVADIVDDVNNGADDIPQINKNAAQGRAYEQQEFSKFSNKVNEAVEQITIKTPEGTKIRVDAIGVEKNTGNLVINEFKSSQTAPLTPNQKVGFPQLEASGGTVVGKGKGIFTGGFEIPAGTKVEIIRPPK